MLIDVTSDLCFKAQKSRFELSGNKVSRNGVVILGWGRVSACVCVGGGGGEGDKGAPKLVIVFFFLSLKLRFQISIRRQFD